MQAPEYLKARLALASLAVASFAVVACSEAVEGAAGTEDPLVEDLAPVVEEEKPPVRRAPTPTPIEDLTVNTQVSDNGPMAGEPIEVKCEVVGLAVSQEEPATHWELYELDPDLAHAPEVDGNVVVFKSAGEYKVRCILTETSWIDPTPAKVTVHPAEALSVETTVEPSTIAAGTTASVTCEGEDAFGNVIAEEGWDLLLAPGGAAPGLDGGLVASELKLKGITVGTYHVACVQVGGKTDDTPALVTVEHGQPYRLRAILGDPAIVAGTSTSLTCVAEDKWGNSVPDLPMAVDLPSKLSLAGLAVTGTVTGKYAVKCVPQALDWTLFVLEPAVLEILPDVPVSLEVELSPPKPFFTTYEIIQILTTARDQYLNPIPDAPIGPLEVNAEKTAWKQTQPKAIMFKEEGVFTLTVRLAEKPAVEASIDIAIDGAPPSVTVTHPLRGATVQNSKPSVTIEGLANDTITKVTTVTVNGQEAEIHEDGTWTLIMIPKWGLNVIEVVATDEQLLETKITQSFYFAELYYPLDPEPAKVPDSIKVWLDDQFIDDGDHNPTHPDDLATLIEGAAAALDLGAALGAAQGTEVGLGYELSLKGISYNPPEIHLTPMYGGLHTKVEVKNLSISIELEQECKFIIDWCPDFSGSAKAGIVVLDADMIASAKNGDLQLAVVNPQIELAALDVDIDGILGFLFDWLIDFLVNIFADTIADMIEGQVSGMFEDVLDELTSALSITQTLDFPSPLPGVPDISLTIETGIWSLTFSPDGGRLGMAARVLATKKVPQVVHGSIARGTCVKGYPTGWQVPGETAFEGALMDDFINHLFAGIWYQGVMNLDLDKDTLMGLLGENGTKDFPLPIDGLAVDTTFMLPPILNGCDPNGLLVFEIGDVFVHMTMLSPLFPEGVAELGVFLSVEASADIVLDDTDEGTAVGVQLYGVDDIHYHWEIVPEFFQGEEAGLEELIEKELIGKLMEDLTKEPLGNIVIPEIDLYELSPIFAQGTVVAPVVEDLFREGGHTLLQGSLE